jgi:Bacterial SH3 domain
MSKEKKDKRSTADKVFDAIGTGIKTIKAGADAAPSVIKAYGAIKAAVAGPPAAAGSMLTVKTPGDGPGRLRAAPGFASAEIAALPPGTVVSVIASVTTEGKTWYHVRPPDPSPEGWMVRDILA